MRFSFVTLFEELIRPYFADAILSRAIERKLFEIECVNPRDFTMSKHKKVDDIVAGGGAGMVLQPQPLFDAISSIKAVSPKAKVIFLTPSAKLFDANDAKRLAKEKHLVLVCGRYEGFDERAIEQYADEVFSIGDFVLTGGELAALVVADSTLRHIKGVLGNEESLLEESFETSQLEAPAFTKPTLFRDKTTPSVLLSGNHKKINEFRAKLADLKTRFFRPDLV
jgi:tRNA (guanine37-N1)-methyltransferase